LTVAAEIYRNRTKTTAKGGDLTIEKASAGPHTVYKHDRPTLALLDVVQLDAVLDGHPA
jgi:hypothetical protein